MFNFFRFAAITKNASLVLNFISPIDNQIMKKLILTVFAVAALGYSSMAQFHVELGLNFNSPQGDFADQYDLGIGAYIEPKYALNENIDLGLLIGANGFAGASQDVGGVTVSAEALTATTVLATGTYRFSTKGVTPYAGLGLGIYAFKAAEISVAGGGVDIGESNTEFGFAPRAGVYLGSLNLGVAYNIVSDASFVQFNLGVRIGGRG